MTTKPVKLSLMMSMFLLALMRNGLESLVRSFWLVSSFTNIKYLYEADKTAFEGDPHSPLPNSNENHEEQAEVVGKIVPYSIFIYQY